MNVINLSLGEPEIDLDRDIVVKAIDAAADAESCPQSRPATTSTFSATARSRRPATPRCDHCRGSDKDSVIADFSSAGPSGIDLGLKPDVSAPGVNIYSSVPSGWDSFSGTSMAAPHVAGAAALLLQRHPTWTPAQIKSALVLTGKPVWSDSSHRHEVPPAREGGGLIDLPAANNR
jgi:subtilisin family serine protease